MLGVLIYSILIWIINVYSFLLLARALMSWFPILPPSMSGVQEILHILTEPLLRPIRNFLWRFPAIRTMPVDLSPLALLLLLSLLRSIVYPIVSILT